jgi:hypothetical protein
VPVESSGGFRASIVGATYFGSAARAVPGMAVPHDCSLAKHRPPS